MQRNTGRLQIHVLNQFPGDFQDTFVKKNSRRFKRDKLYNIKMQVKFVMSQDLLVLEC